MTGDILYHSWGYSMTLVDFYQVVSETPKTVVIEKIGRKAVETGYLSGTTIANPEVRTGKTYRTRKRIDTRTETPYYASTLNQHGKTQYLYPWHGEPMYYNHCD